MSDKVVPLYRAIATVDDLSEGENGEFVSDLAV